MALRFYFLGVISIVVLFGALFFPTFVLAGDGLVTCGGTDCTFCSLMSTVYNVIRWLTAIASLLAGIVLIYAGFKMVTAGGDTSGYVEAKKLFFNAVIGIIIVLAVVAVIYTILMTLLEAGTETVDVKTGFFSGVDCGQQSNTDEGDGLPPLGAPPAQPQGGGGGAAANPPPPLSFDDAVEQALDDEAEGLNVIETLDLESFELSDRPAAVEAFAENCEVSLGGTYEELGGDVLGGMRRVCVGGGQTTPTTVPDTQPDTTQPDTQVPPVDSTPTTPTTREPYFLRCPINCSNEREECTNDGGTPTDEWTGITCNF